MPVRIEQTIIPAMTNIGSGFEYYKTLHTQFNEMCPVINKYVIDLYARPRKFIIETGPMLDRFIREHSMPGAPGARGFPSDAMMEFIALVDDFTIETIALFNEHKAHVDDCKNYMKQVAELESSNQAKCTANVDYARLALEVVKLHNGLLIIKQKADKIINRLEAIESTWNNIKGKMHK